MTQHPGKQIGNVPVGPLSGLRVLELADEKGQFCGKLMADLGSDVIKIEPPGGQSTRSIGPFVDDMPDRERSLSFWHYNTSKRGITLNLESSDGQRLFRRLVPTADVVLESYPAGYLPSLGLGYQDLAPQNSRLIMCSLTPFGQTGPWRDYRTSDMLTWRQADKWHLQGMILKMYRTLLQWRQEGATPGISGATMPTWAF